MCDMCEDCVLAFPLLLNPGGVLLVLDDHTHSKHHDSRSTRFWTATQSVT